MIILRSDSDSVECVSRVLLEGSVVVLPTDTVYGFSGVVPESEDVIRKIKGRDETKPFIQLIAEPEDIYRYTDEVLPDQWILGYCSGIFPGAVRILWQLRILIYKLRKLSPYSVLLLPYYNQFTGQNPEKSI